MHKLFFLLIVIPVIVFAHEDELYVIDEWVRNGDIAITFKPDGSVSSVLCNTRKNTPKECEHFGEHVFDYYHRHKGADGAGH